MNETQAGGDGQKKGGQAINIVLWIVQGLLAFSFGMAGFTKAFQPIEVVVQSMPWAADVVPPMVRFIGISEFLAAIGLMVPALTRIKPQLTALAGLGLAIVMASASVFHLWRGEFMAVPFNGTFLAMAAFVAYGRWKLVPFSAKDKTETLN